MSSKVQAQEMLDEGFTESQYIVEFMPNEVIFIVDGHFRVGGDECIGGAQYQIVVDLPVLIAHSARRMEQALNIVRIFRQQRETHEPVCST